MDFLGIGWEEILFILVVALLIWGPGKLVEISRSLGKTVFAFKKALNDITVQVNREMAESKKEKPARPVRLENSEVFNKTVRQ